MPFNVHVDSVANSQEKVTVSRNAICCMEFQERIGLANPVPF